MTKYIIFIKLLLLQPVDAKMAYGLEISHFNDKPLYFLSQKDCAEYVRANLYHLHWYALSRYDAKVTVEAIYCLGRTSA